MNRKNNRRKLIWVTIFIALVALSGVALAASGNLENPLAAITGGRTDGPPGGMEGRRAGRGGAEAQDAPTAAGTGSETQRPFEGGRGGEGGDQNTINWSAVGSVLNNVWFLFAMTAVVIVLQMIWDSAKQVFKRREPQVASAP